MRKRITAIASILAVAMMIGPRVWGADPQQPIPLGTVITQQNWQQYSQYMGEPLKHMFMSTSPVSGWPSRAQAIVGPTLHYPLPKAYWDATEKYAKQVQLVKVPNGSYTLKGYVAGLPFPDLKADDPLAGYKLVYDVYFQHTPAIQVNNQIQVIDIDHYGNEADLLALVVTFQWLHNTDAGYPMNVANTDVYLSGEAEQLAPEQIKYITAVNFTWDDPDRLPESYVFLPSLRRALRLSSNARCAPFQGQDFANDDITPVPLPPTWFKAQFLGKQKLLSFIFKPDEKTRELSKDRGNWDKDKGNYIPKASVFGASWQLRDTYVLAMQRLPQYTHGYCYADRRHYLDAEQAEALGWCNWDQNDKFYRDMVVFAMPEKYKNSDGWYVWGNVWAHDGCDYQTDHCSQLLPAIGGNYMNQDTPPQFQNRTLYGTPGGLQQIMR
ncbi:MAG TPA: DUF1329 domain-containing protein [Candidatus Binataceae bacterium]|nr:DUF1329 domain-containing protein [Candidatus Binataceae bacterium]